MPRSQLRWQLLTSSLNTAQRTAPWTSTILPGVSGTASANSMSGRPPSRATQSGHARTGTKSHKGLPSSKPGYTRNSPAEAAAPMPNRERSSTTTFSRCCACSLASTSPCRKPSTSRKIWPDSCDHSSRYMARRFSCLGVSSPSHPACGPTSSPCLRAPSSTAGLTGHLQLDSAIALCFD